MRLTYHTALRLENTLSWKIGGTGAERWQKCWRWSKHAPKAEGCATVSINSGNIFLNVKKLIFHHGRVPLFYGKITSFSILPFLYCYIYIYMGGNLLTVQSLILVSYFLYFWAPFLATYRFAMPKIATLSENIWAPDGLHASVWTISTFHIALFSEKLCPVAFLTK